MYNQDYHVPDHLFVGGYLKQQYNKTYCYLIKKVADPSGIGNLGSEGWYDLPIKNLNWTILWGPGMKQCKRAQ